MRFENFFGSELRINNDKVENLWILNLIYYNKDKTLFALI